MKKNKLLILSSLVFISLISCSNKNSNSSSSLTSSSNDSSISTSIETSSLTTSSTNSSSSSTNQTTSIEDVYKIINVNQNVTLLYVNETAKFGDEITFGYKINAGFSLAKSNILTITCNDNNISFIDNNDGTYTFTMPKGDVKINIKTINSLYKIELNDEKSLISSIECKYSLDYLDDEALTDTYESILYHDYKGEYTKSIRIKVRSTSSFIPTNIHIKGNKFEKVFNIDSLNDEFIFEMPNENIVVSLEYKENSHNIHYFNNEHVNVEFYSLNNNEYTKINKIFSNSEVYLKYVVTDSNYGVVDINVTYQESYSDEEKTINILESSPNNDGYYKLKIPFLKDNTEIVVNIVEKAMGKYQDYSFLGTYFMTSLNSKNYGQLSAPTIKMITIDSSGIFKQNDTTYQINSIEGNKTEGIAKGSDASGNKFSFAYKGDYLLADDSFDESIITSTPQLGIKKTPEIISKLDPQYPNYLADYCSIYGEIINYNNSNPSLGSIYIYQLIAKEDKSVIKTVLIDTKTNNYYFDNVSLEFTSTNTSLISNSSDFIIKINNETYCEVNGSNKSTYRHIILDGIQGSYHKENETTDTLVLDGKGGLTFNGESSTYELTNNTITFQILDTTYVINIDISNKTYSIVSSQTSEYDLSNKTYSGKGNYTDSYDIYNDCDITIKFYDKNQCYVTWTESYYDEDEFGYVEDTYLDGTTLYKYSISNNIISINYTVYNQKYVLKLKIKSINELTIEQANGDRNELKGTTLKAK